MTCSPDLVSVIMAFSCTSWLTCVFFTPQSLVESIIGKNMVIHGTWDPRQPNRLELVLKGGAKVSVFLNAYVLPPSLFTAPIWLYFYLLQRFFKLNV